MPSIEIEKYVSDLIKKLRLAFPGRLVYVGLQGSFRRGEATDASDIDIMVTLDKLTVTDLDRYREVIFGMPYAERSCGFISGREELKNWPSYEICQLLHETKDYYGELRPLLPKFELDDVKNYIRISIGNLYHMLCHSRIHAKPETHADTLCGLYKTVFYILQNACYVRSGQWIMTKAELLSRLQGLDREVLAIAMSLKSASEYDVEKAYGILFDWCRQLLMEK
jgi:hypothetical protein